MGHLTSEQLTSLRQELEFHAGTAGPEDARDGPRELPPPSLYAAEVHPSTSSGVPSAVLASFRRRTDRWARGPPTMPAGDAGAGVAAACPSGRDAKRTGSPRAAPDFGRRRRKPNRGGALPSLRRWDRPGCARHRLRGLRRDLPPAGGDPDPACRPPRLPGVLSQAVDAAGARGRRNRPQGRRGAAGRRRAAPHAWPGAGR